MFKNIVFEGKFNQHIFKSLREKDGHIFPVEDPKTTHFNVDIYDPFEMEDLLPSLVRLVQKVNRKGKQKEKCKKWIQDNGFLTVPDILAEEIGQSLDDFWKEALAIVDLWLKYKDVVNRDIEALKSYVKIKTEPLSEYEIKNGAFLWGAENDGKVIIQSNIPELNNKSLGILLKNVEEDPLAPYQVAVFHYIAEKITHNAGNVYFSYEKITKVAGSDSDILQISVSVNPQTLIQALYLQFMQQLTERRKVCPACWRSFTVTRNDRTYCNDGCKSTYNSRKYRKEE